MDFVPPSEVFEVPPQAPHERLAEGTYDIAGATGEATRTSDGEMCTIFSGFPYPRKGVVYAEAVDANNEVKRRTLSTFAPFACKEFVLPALGFLLLPFSWKVRFLEKFLENYLREVDYIYYRCERVPYLKKEFYNNCSKALWDLVSAFMQRLGFSKAISERMGKLFATQFEYDDTYKLRFMDPMSTVTKEEVLASPRKFLDKFMRLAKERDITTDPKTNLVSEIPSITHKKFRDFGLLLKYALYHPKIKKAFKESIAESNFAWLQLDEIERFWHLNRYDYNLEGRSFPDRFDEYIKCRAAHIQKINNADAVEIRKNDDGTMSLTPLYEETTLNANVPEPALVVES